MTNEQLVEAAQSLKCAVSFLEDRERAVKKAKETVRLLREETIPGMMSELGVISFELEDGGKITVSQEVYASIPKANRPEAFAWLNDTGNGGLIKTQVITSFGKGERENAIIMKEEMQNNGFDTAFKEDVHTSTLKAFIKEQLREGNDIPLDLFGARPVMTARIK